ncbi:MAG: hypothetical protein LH609_22845 [Rudanella sp.]|nr:hypothetical protein [Rudanella sp.]
MSLKSANTDILMQLAQVVGQLTNADYTRPSDVLSGNTIGKHVRHILEFYQLLVNHAQSGYLNYNLEHAIYRMALIQVTVRDSFPELDLPENFGVAYSTV